MSNELVTIVESMQPSFEKVNTENLPFHKETEFALQALEKADFLMKTAINNKQSLRNAIVNVAAIGLSLNPALKLAYLVPRMGEVCLDIPYIGLIKLATDSGSITWAQAEIIRANDKFVWKGLGKEVEHEVDWMSDRGEIKGVYAVGKTKDGDYLTTVMTLEQCYRIRDRSEAYKSYLDKKIKSCPWVTDEEEMLKKTVIKRAQKTWPKTERLAKAIEVLNRHEGIDFEAEKKDEVLPSVSKLDELKSKLAIAMKTEKALLASLPDHKCQSIDELNADQVAYSIRLIDQLIQNKKGAAK